MAFSLRLQNVHCPLRSVVIKPACCSNTKYCETVDCDNPTFFSIKPTQTPSFSMSHCDEEKCLRGSLSHCKIFRRFSLDNALRTGIIFITSIISGFCDMSILFAHIWREPRLPRFDWSG